MITLESSKDFQIIKQSNPDWCVVANRLLGYLDAMAANNSYISESDLKQLKYELGLLPYDTIITDTPKANFK